MFIKWPGRSKPVDLSKNYADPGIALKQRELVDKQLEAMRDGNPPVHFKVAGLVLSQLREQTGLTSLRVLDAGCGSAYYSEILNHFVPGWIRYAGVDFNGGMVRMARQCYPRLPLARMDLRNLAVFDASFDLVMSGAAIVHVKEWDVAARELSRVTRRWLMLHRTLVYKAKATSVNTERHYDTDVYRVRINEEELLALMANQGMALVMKCGAGEGEFPPDEENNTYLFERRGS